MVAGYHGGSVPGNYFCQKTPLKGQKKRKNSQKLGPYPPAGRGAGDDRGVEGGTNYVLKLLQKKNGSRFISKSAGRM